MVRTQIYLDEVSKEELDRLSAERRTTVSKLIRQAIEQFLQKGPSRFEESLDRSFGIWRKRKDLPRTADYVRKMRHEWNKRVSGN